MPATRPANSKSLLYLALIPSSGVSIVTHSHTQQPSAAMSPLFSDLTETTAPAAALPLLANAREVFGFVPNLAIIMAAEPASLESYFHSLEAFSKTALSPIEQQIVLMAVSRVNQANYSLAVHAALATKLGAAPELVKAVGTGRKISDPKLAALRRFTETLTVTRGQVPDAETDAFLAAGYSRTAVVAVAFGVAVKTFANSLALLAQTPVDAPFAPALSGLQA
jgi:AhpD family alkylhydroperoxidase